MSLVKKLPSKYLLVGLLFVVASLISVFPKLSDNKLHIKIYDIGQGDSILVTSPSGSKLLIDGGPNNKVLSYLGKDLSFLNRKLDFVVLTHPHEDHLAGLIEVVKRYEVGQVWMEPVVHTTEIYSDWLKLLKEKNLKVGAPKPGDELTFDDGLKIKVLWPTSTVLEDGDLNKTSIVLLLEYGKFKALLTGDAGEESQPYGLTSMWPKDLSLPLLKVPHHGSKTGLKQEFLDLVKPQISVISVGAKNKYGHPSLETIQKLEKVGSKVYRTDKSGSVEVVTDGVSWYTRTER